jgi:MoaA/NifB/PqqE/SkfB family radical SAM enzyme
MCDQWSEPFNEPELSKEEWFKVIDSAANLRPAAILLTGGEPFLRPDIFEIIRYISDKGIATHLCTNGTLLDESAVDRLKGTGINTISVSLDSYLPRVHNYIRGKDVFEEVIAGIKRLRKRMPEVKIGINCLISRLNFRGIDRMVDLAGDLGADQVKFDTVHTHLKHRRNSLAEGNGLVFLKDDLPQLSVELDRLIKALSKSTLLTNSKTFINGISGVYKGKFAQRHCFAGYISCTIDAFGNVSACDNSDSFENVRERSLEEIWRSAGFQRLREKVKSCPCQCWDSTHAEINIRCTNIGLLKEIRQVARELDYYC